MTDATEHHLGRNDPCHCGSGKKYKRCCLDKDEAAEREARAEAAAKTAAAPAKKQPPPKTQAPHSHTDKPWKRGADSYQPFKRFVKPRSQRGDG